LTTPPPNDRAVPPIDVTTGWVVLTGTDAPGVSRTHVSNYRLGQWFGESWASTLDQRLEVEPDALRLVLAAGTVLSYPVPVNGSVVFPASGARRPLRRVQGGYEVTDAEHRVLFFNRHLLSIVDSGGNRVVFHRDDAGNPVAIESSDGHRVDVDTSDGLVTALRSGGTTLVRYRYEQRRLVEVTDAKGATTRFDYDTTGRVVRWEDAAGRWYGYYFDPDGRVVKAGGANGHLARELAYDAGGTHVTDSLGHVTHHKLDERRRVVAVTDPLGNTTRYEWDGRDRLVAHTDALGHTTRYQLDAAGNVVALTRPDGSTITQGYDERYRPVTTVGADGAVWRREYDARGKLVRTTDPAGHTCAEPDTPAAVEPHTDALTRAYDTEQRLVSVTNERGQVWRHTHDAAGNLVGETDFDGRTTRYGYDAAGRLTSARNADAEVAFTYDVLGRVVAESINGRTVRSEYDVAGRRTTRRTPSGALSRFTYDAAHRLVALHTVGRAVWLSYDGREVTLRLHGTVDDKAIELRPGFEPRSGLDMRPGFDVRVPAAGWQFQWDGDRLAGVTAPDGRRWRYRYDALGRRIAKQRLDDAGRITEQTQFTWDGANLAEEVRSGPGQPTVALVWEWVPGTARVVTQTRRVLGGGALDFHAVVTDPAGTPCELVDETGKVAWRRGEGPGKVYTPLGRPGEYHDAHGVSSLTAAGPSLR
jgi:YD repeat-containing protein